MRGAIQITSLKKYAKSPLVLWVCFVLVHIVLCLLCFHQGGMGDVTLVYKKWLTSAVHGNGTVGITSDWVYPILAWIPIAASLLFGFANYATTWLLLTTAVNALGFAVLLRNKSKCNYLAAWWWLAFLMLLGPIALGRIEAFTVPFAIIGLLWLEHRPKIATVLLTIITWIKVWPAALLLAAGITLKKRQDFVRTVLGTSGVVVGFVIILGGVRHILSFLLSQTGRGIQVEAPVGAFWLVPMIFHKAGYFIFHSSNLNTYQLYGPGIALVSSAMNIVLAAAVIIVIVVGTRAVKQQVETNRVLPLLSLALITALIAFNKVGSPQYVCWLAAPVIFGLIKNGRDFATPAKYVLGIAGLTQLVYPYLYDTLLAGNPWMIIILTVRNALYLVLIWWLIRELQNNRKVSS